MTLKAGPRAKSEEAKSKRNPFEKAQPMVACSVLPEGNMKSEGKIPTTELRHLVRITMPTSSGPEVERVQTIYKISLHNPSFSKSSTPLDPTDLIITICTCELKNTKCSPFLKLMAQLRDSLASYLSDSPTIKSVTFFYCDNSDQSSTSHFPYSVMPNGKRSPDWQFPSSFRSIFEQDARYFGPWLPEEELVGSGGLKAWKLNRYSGRGGVDWSLKLTFVDAKEVRPAGKCVSELKDDILKELVLSR